MKQRSHFILLILLLVLGAGCSNTPDKSHPLYAPAEPIVYPENSPREAGGSLYNAGQNLSLFADVRARQVGDIVSVLLFEATDAAKRSDTNLDKSSSNAMANPILAGQTRIFGKDNSLEFDLSSDSSFEGGGGSNQSNSLQGSIAVQVAQVMPNGNLYVQGEKWIHINQGNEYIRLRGIIRPVDIGSDNTILSTKVADARISYGGTGPTAQVNSPGWLSRFFLSPLSPF